MAGTPGNNAPHTTNPLGGRIHNRQARSALLRQWSGYVALVRMCPTCHAENYESNLYCTECATPLADVTPTAAENARAGIRHVQRRIAREELARSRHRVESDRGGSGWLITGSALLLLAVSAHTGLWVTLGIWLAGLASAIWGLWQLRANTGALRGWGIALAAVATGMILLVGSRSLATSTGQDTTSLELAATPQATPAAQATAIASRADLAPVPMAGGDARHTGQQPGPAPATNPRLAWRFDAGSEIYGSPALSAGRVFLTTKAGELVAVDAGTGTALWRFDLSDYVVRSSPAVIDDVVYVGGGFNLFAVDAETGKKRWSVPLRYAGQSAPTVAGDLVVVGSQEGWVYGINKDSGEMIWRSPADGLIFGSPAVDHDMVVFGTDAGNVYALDAADGSVSWRATIDGAVYASASILGDAAIVQSTAGKIFALDLREGTPLWSGDVGGDRAVAALGNAGSGTGGSVVVTADDGGVYALAVRDGAQQWLHPSGRPESGPAVTALDTVVLGSGQTVIALDGATGKPIWTYLAGDTVTSAPIVTGGYVFFGAADGFLYAISDR